MDSRFPSYALRVEEWAEQFFNSFEIYVVSSCGLAGPYTMCHSGSQGDTMGVGLYTTAKCARTKFHQGVVLQHKKTADLSSRAEQHTYNCLDAPWDPSIKVLQIVYSDDRRGTATSPQDMAHMYNAFSHGYCSTGGSSQCKKRKMYGARPRNSTLEYIDGDVETMRDMFTLQKFDLKMTGIPPTPGEIPREPILKFTTRLSTLQGILAQLQPSFVLMLCILITHTLSVVDYVFSAIPVQAEWVQLQQIQIKRIACKALCIPVRTLNMMRWAGLDDMGFAVSHMFSRLRCQSIKGVFPACNNRSAYTKETTRTLMLYPNPNIPRHPDWITAQWWMARHDVSFRLPADLTECPITIQAHPRRRPHPHV